ncbi:uncharacterized protein LOC123535954 [Mercenaria mercenaria]|uniref:uncharacterized protein LOC123535954 n=1 Tax=Mercenaria mercenaria TaxID=6596 RepID=UPI00234F2DA1|nr:uncharacterized protein LOC123535954 [Mercenaria mercenaria]
MESEWFERDSDYLLVEGQCTDELQSPLRRSTRLKYNCVSVSNKLVAFGSNTGGIYIFSRTDQKLLQIAFADKETNSVSLVKISPHEKYVAFVSSNNVYVLDLKLESRSKAETLRSTSDLSGCLVTNLLWDQTSAKLYIGDDLGKVSMMPVYSNKAKNLFSIPLEVIMKLDSAIVQLDKAEDKILVSTVTRCYLCDTNKQNYSQIGKKLRDGNFGACFLTQGSSAPMIYSARPGSRIWEVDFEGNVLNTHQFKQLLAVPPSHVVSLDQKYRSSSENSTCKAQSVGFPKLIILRNNFLLTWTASSVFVLDPINVKVILWTNQFSGIQDICCLDKEIYIFFESMKLQSISFQSVTTVIPLFIRSNDIESAALLCINHRNVFLLKHVRKKIGLNELNSIYDKLVSGNMGVLADQIHEVIVNVENKISDESENETSGSGRSRSGSAISGTSVGGVLSGGSNSAITGNSSAIIEKNEIEMVTCDVDPKNPEIESDINQNLNKNHKDVISKDDISSDRPSLEDKTVRPDISCTSNVQKQSKFGNEIAEDVNKVEAVEYNNTAVEDVENISVDDIDGKLEGEQEIIDESVESDKRTEINGDSFEEHMEKEGNGLTGNVELGKEYEEQAKTENGEAKLKDSLNGRKEDFNEKFVDTNTVNGIKQSLDIKENLAELVPENDNGTAKSDLCTDHGYNTSNLHVSDVKGTVSPVALATNDADDDLHMEVEDDVGFLPVVGQGARRLSLTSLSSVDSAEVYLDQPFPNEFDEVSDKIAIPMKRKSSKKKNRRKSTAFETRDTKAEVRMTRSQSLGTPDNRERAVSPQGSVHSVKEEDSISVYSNDSVIEEGNTGSAKDMPDGINTNKCAESISIGSPLSVSGDFGQSEEFSKSADYLQNGEFSPGEATLSRSWEKNKQSPSAPKTALLQLKNKMQTKVTSSTKNLIRNIKEKNLLTKAKEFAENLSQGSEVYLHSGEGQFHEIPDVLMTYPNFGQHLKETNKQISLQTEDVDVVDGLDKAIVDCAELEKITLKTKEKMLDIEILTNPDTVYTVLSDWVSVLNKTFQEFHLKKYCDIENDKSENNELSESLKVNETASHVIDCDMVLKTQNCEAVEKNDPKESDETSQVNVDCDLVGNKCQTDKHRIVRNSESVIKILSDRDFCYLTDPLCISSDLFQDVCELTQACFDIGCHGDILKFIEFRFCEKNFPENNHDLPDAEKVVTDVSDTDVVIKADKDYTENLETATSSEKKCATDNGRDCDKSFPCDDEEHSDKNKLKEDLDESEIGTEASNLPEVKHNSLGDEEVEIENLAIDSRTALTGGKSNAEKLQLPNEQSCETNSANGTDKHFGTDFNEAAKQKENGITGLANDDEIQDKAMAFFVRCYFPYLTVFRVREETLKGKCCYNVWSALVTCMEGKARYDGEKYGIEDKSIIQYLLENQAVTDQGAMLLGHISNLFHSNLGSVVDICVRSHPFVHPLDVMYLCRHHQVAVETVLKQYMIWMTMDETSAIKKQILSDIGKHLEVCLVWSELLLSENDNTSTGMDENGCPRCMAHKMERKNEALIDEFTSHIQAADDQQMLLEMFRKHGYWVGVLKLLKKIGPRSDHLKLVLQLGDIDLLTGQNDLGYQPESICDWQEVLAAYQKISETGNQATQEVSCDWSKLITWNNLAVLLVRHIGSEEALSLLEKHDIPEGVLSKDFYQVCLLSGMVQRQQKLLLHSMLEKVDSYLWSQRPTALTPQVQYLAAFEKKTPAEGAGTGMHTDLLQAMVGSLKERETFEQYMEDPECHWGIETKINLLCPCCYISLKETVSHEEPGVLIFRCGHGFHKFCLPKKECMLCDGVLEAETTQKAFYI